MNDITQSDLPDIATSINEHHRSATKAATSAIEFAKQAGELLKQAKSLVPHGEWLPWLNANCEVSPRQAQRYMQVSDNWNAIVKNDTVSHLTFRGLSELLALDDPKPEPKQIKTTKVKEDGQPKNDNVSYLEPPPASTDDDIEYADADEPDDGDDVEPIDDEPIDDEPIEPDEIRDVPPEFCPSEICRLIRGLYLDRPNARPTPEIYAAFGKSFIKSAPHFTTIKFLRHVADTLKIPKFENGCRPGLLVYSIVKHFGYLNEHRDVVETAFADISSKLPPSKMRAIIDRVIEAMESEVQQ